MAVAWWRQDDASGDETIRATEDVDSKGQTLDLEYRALAKWTHPLHSVGQQSERSETVEESDRLDPLLSAEPALTQAELVADSVEADPFPWLAEPQATSHIFPWPAELAQWTPAQAS